MSAYRPLPIVEAVEASDCRECRHAWSCSEPITRNPSWSRAAREGRCTFFERRPWGRLLIWLGLREPKRRLKVRP